MRTLFCATILALLSVQVLTEDLMPYQELPVFKIDLDVAPEERFNEVTTQMKPQILKMVNDYLHLCPRFVRSFFESNEDVIKMRHLENYEEITGMATILELDSYILLMLNYAFELGKALCTSIVARQADGKIIHGRNMDFGFPDAMRNASYVGQFYKNGELLFEAVMFGGYVGVASGFMHNQYSLTLNARGVEKGIDEYFTIMGKIYAGVPEIGIATRDAMTACKNFQCV